MNAVKLIIDDNVFLLPESHSDNYDTDYLSQHKEKIQKLIFVYKKWLENPLENFSNKPDLKEFKTKTGVIGYPFDGHDVGLYIIDRRVNILLEINI